MAWRVFFILINGSRTARYLIVCLHCLQLIRTAFQISMHNISSHNDVKVAGGWVSWGRVDIMMKANRRSRSTLSRICVWIFYFSLTASFIWNRNALLLLTTHNHDSTRYALFSAVYLNSPARSGISPGVVCNLKLSLDVLHDDMLLKKMITRRVVSNYETRFVRRNRLFVSSIVISDFDCRHNRH